VQVQDTVLVTLTSTSIFSVQTSLTSNFNIQAIVQSPAYNSTLGSYSDQDNKIYFGVDAATHAEGVPAVFYLSGGCEIYLSRADADPNPLDAPIGILGPDDEGNYSPDGPVEFVSPDLINGNAIYCSIDPDTSELDCTYPRGDQGEAISGSTWQNGGGLAATFYAVATA
jgi:hypothetical protein